MAKNALILRGSSGNGKTTLAKALYSEMPGKAAFLEHDWFRWSIHRGNRPGAELTDDEHRFVFHNLVTVIGNYAVRGEYNLLVEGLFTWDNQDSPQGNARAITNVLAEHDWSYASVVLTAEKPVLMARNETREAYTVPQPEFDRLYAGAYSSPPGETEIVLDTTNLGIDEALACLRGIPTVHQMMQGV